jgi:ribosomal protein S18 acetylase RimI-like enzyme
MHAHHAEVASLPSEVAGFRDPGEAWEQCRAQFEGWMSEGDAWLLIAEQQGSPVGFAFFRIRDGDPAFTTEDRIAELEALSVPPELRRWGIGSLIMEEVERLLARAGISFIALSLVAGNDDALRFYERWGIAPAHVRCLGRTIMRS